MNIGKVSASGFQESKGNNILERKLEEKGTIKTYFGKENTIPNVDGFFILVNTYREPKKEFVVQIKTVDGIGQNTKGTFYDCDTKFINYISTEVSENPAFVFVIDTKAEQVYFKYLSPDFLKANDFTQTEQESFRLFFLADEVLTDIDAFVEKLHGILEERNTRIHNIDQEEMLDFQKAFDFINGFFDNDFKKIKDFAFDDLWKFGIVYYKRKLTAKQHDEIVKARSHFDEEVTDYTMEFGVFRIKNGENLQIIQNQNLFEKMHKVGFSGTNLQIHGDYSWSNATKTSIEERAHKWLGDTVRDIFNMKAHFIQFMPSEVLREMIFVYLDMIAEMNPKLGKPNYHGVFIEDEMSYADLREIMSMIPVHHARTFEFAAFKIASHELYKRGQMPAKRIWKHKDESKYWGSLGNSTHVWGFKQEDYLDNFTHLFNSLPKLYEETIKNIFGDSHAKYLVLKGEYIMSFELKSKGNMQTTDYQGLYIKDTYLGFNIVDSDEYEKLKKAQKYDVWSGGRLQSDFRKGTPLLDNLLYMVYRSICKVKNLSIDGIPHRMLLQADFRVFD